MRGCARHFLLCLFITVVFGLVCAPLYSHPRGSMPNWRAGEAIRDSELIAVVEGPVFKNVFPRVSAPEVFGIEGEARIYRFTTRNILWGDCELDSEIVIVQPPMSDHRHFASVYNGEGLVFLRKMSAEDVERIRQLLRWGADHLPDVVWIFTETEHQWMSWVQFVVDLEGERQEHMRGPLVAQLSQQAGVEPRADNIIEYVSSLIAMRQDILVGVDRSLQNELDPFQRDVASQAYSEKEELESRQ